MERLLKMKVETIKKLYKKGMKVKLINMYGEPQMKFGICGTIEFVDDIGQIHVNWNNGSNLALNIDVDTFRVL